MNLLIVSQYFWPEDFRINDLVAELSRRGHSITVLTGIPNYPGGRAFPSFKADPRRFGVYTGATVVRVPMLTRGRGKLRLALNYLSYAVSATVVGPIRLRGKRFDGIFVFEPSPVTVGVPAVALRRIKRAPMLFWVLDQWPETLAAVGVVRSEPLLRLVGQLVSFIYRHCDRVLVQSRALMSVVAKYSGHTPVEYFPNWVEASYLEDASTPAEEIGPSSASLSILYAGNIGEAQDFPALIDAIDAVADDERIRWLIVGDGRAAEWARSEIARRGLEHRAIMLGRFPQSRMNSFFKRADALLVTLKRDPVFSMTVPGKVQTYMAAGLPILGMLDGEGARIIDESRCGLTGPAGDFTKLANNARLLASLGMKEREEMGSNGRAYAAREFDRTLLFDKLEKRFHDLTPKRADISP